MVSDANGNLAATPLSGFPSAGSVAALSTIVSGLQADLTSLTQYAIDSRREARRGIASAMAMATAPLRSGLSDMEAELEKLTMDARRAPERVLEAHLVGQRP
jgi:hypothetical protein